MNKRKRKSDFFDDMLHYKECRFNRLHLLLSGIEAVILLSGIIITGLIIWDIVIQSWVAITALILVCLGGYIGILNLAIFATKNSDDFARGKFSSGMANFLMLLILAAVIVGILIVILPDKWQSIIPAIIAAIVAILCAVLAIMGVHYTETKKRETRRYNNKLIFSIEKKFDEAIEYKLEREMDSKYTSLCIKNISDNYGSFYGVYRIGECSVVQIGKDFKYAPIAPKTSYIIKSIGYKELNEQFILVYKDIEDVYYYLHCQVISSRKIDIIRSGVCDMNYIRMRIKETMNTRKNI